MKNITLLIGTCDSYSILWNNFVTLTDKYWNIDCKKIFVTETKIPNYPGYDVHAPGKLPWSDRMASALKSIDTEYVFFILEDYFFTEEINQEEILFHTNFLEEVKGNKVMLDVWCRHLTLINERKWNDRTLYRLSPHSNYLTSMQPSVWKTDHLKKCMKENWSPWEFEIPGTNNIKGSEHGTYLMLRDHKLYWNAVRQGLKLCPGWDEIKQLHQLQDMNL